MKNREKARLFLYFHSHIERISFFTNNEACWDDVEIILERNMIIVWGADTLKELLHLLTEKRKEHESNHTKSSERAIENPREFLKSLWSSSIDLPWGMFVNELIHCRREAEYRLKYRLEIIDSHETEIFSTRESSNHESTSFINLPTNL